MSKSYEEYLEETGNVHLAYYVEAADILGIEYEVLIKNLLAIFRKNQKHWYIINATTPLTNAPSTTIAKRKNLTHRVLSQFDIPVPIQSPLLSKEDAIEFFKKYKDIVIKPTVQLGGKGVTIKPKDIEDVERAYINAKKYSKAKGTKKVIGEEFVSGENYRLLVLEDKVIGIVRRKSAFIIGNGKDSVEKLIEDKNIERKEHLLKPIVIDNEVRQRLDDLEIDMQYIPNENEELILRYNCNLSTGGTTQECSADTHQYYKDLAIKSVKAIGSKFGGVDIITPDITKPSKCVINEINYNPGLRLHYKVQEGEAVKVAIPVMEYIYKMIDK